MSVIGARLKCALTKGAVAGRALRDFYQKHLTPVAQNWPTVFQNEDILIKEVPK